MNREQISGIFLLGMGVAVFLKALTYPMGTLRKPGGGLFPLVASVLLIGLAGLLTIQVFRAKGDAQASRTPFFPDREAPRRILYGFAGLLGYRYLLPVVGFSASTGIFILFLTRFLGRYSWMVSIGFAAVTAVISYYLFQVWLKIPMPIPIFGK